MKKQTAVEWLIDEIRNHIKEHGRLDAITISALKTMAKGTEKQQIQDAFEEGENNSVDYFVPEHRIKESEQYYNETYL